MRGHHKRAIDKLINELKDDSRYLALIISGSVARGRERENSDIDIMLVATEEEFARRQALRDFTYARVDICDYPEGYVEGHVVSLQFLKDVNEKGSEPARSFFSGAFTAFSHIPGLEKLVSDIPRYKEGERSENIKSFYAQVEVYLWFMGEAEKRNDLYLKIRAASELVLFGGRLILAYNRILFPHHKWFMYELANAPEKPEEFFRLSERLLQVPNSENALAFCNCISEFTDWETDPAGCIVRFTEDSEWNWLAGKAPVHDR